MILKLIYSILYFFVIIFLFPFQYWKRPENIRRRWLREKFGIFNYSLGISKSPHPTFNKGCGIIWIHAVSVGEVTAAIPFLRRLREKFPYLNLLLSTITDTGQKIALERVPDQTKVVYLPFDISALLNNTIRQLQPKLFITMETELWPNLFRALNNNDVPAVILNGRISDNSFKGYKKIRFFLKDIFSCIDLFGMQDHVYAQKIMELGAPKDKVKVIGNFKFDTMPSEKMLEWTKSIRSPVIIAGSTHKGEEKLMISVFSQLKKDFPDLTLIIAPRHPERFKEVEELVKKKGLEYIKRSHITPPYSSSYRGEDRRGGVVVILDAVGELASAYKTADIAVMGGSFIKHGGQNPLEPAYWGKAIVCGPHMENFPFIDEFYKNGGAVKTGADNLRQSLKELLSDQGKMSAMGKTAKELYEKNSGAVERAMKEIERYL